MQNRISIQSKSRVAGFLAAVALASLAWTGAARAADAPVPLRDFERIVIADDAMPVTKLAATELATYAGKIVNKKLAVVPVSEYDKTQKGLSFFVGESAAKTILGAEVAPWKREEYLIRSIPQGLVLAGADEPGDAWSQSTSAGSALAVYTLLDDHLGVKWFWPGAFGEHVPSNPDAKVPALNVRTAPAFSIRNYMVGYPGYRTLAFSNDVKHWTRRTRQGWTEAANFSHSWQTALDVLGAMKQEHPPEWLALVRGKRRGMQVCTTHPHVLDKMVDYVLAHKNDIVTISPNDGYGFCECNEETKSETHKRLNLPSCTSLDVVGEKAMDGHLPSLSDRIYTYANTIARRVREQQPNKKVGMFAYTYYTRPPKNIKQMEPNILLSFVHQVMSNKDPETEREWKATMAQWHKLGIKIVMREGWGNHYLMDLPFPQEKQVIEGIAYAHQNGIVAVYGEGSKAFSTQAPNTWAVVRMMWDPARDASGLMDDFYNSAYGPAAPEMKAFFGTYSDALTKHWPGKVIIPTRGLGYTNMINSWPTFYPKSVLEEADKHLKAAEAKAATLSKEYSERIAFHRFGQEYTKCMIELFECYGKLGELGLPLGNFVNPQKNKWPEDATPHMSLLRRAYELGEQREKMLLEHRDWAALDEGLYAAPNDGDVRRQWHATVKKALNIEHTPLTKDSLKAMDVANKKSGSKASG